MPKIISGEDNMATSGKGHVDRLDETNSMSDIFTLPHPVDSTLKLEVAFVCTQLNFRLYHFHRCTCATQQSRM